MTGNGLTIMIAACPPQPGGLLRPRRKAVVRLQLLPER